MLKHVCPPQPAYRVPAILRGVVSQQILFPSLADVGGQIVAGQIGKQRFKTCINRLNQINDQDTDLKQAA